MQLECCFIVGELQVKYSLEIEMLQISVLLLILVGDQLDAQFLLYYVYLNSLRVLSNSVLMLRTTVVFIQHLV